VAGREDHAPPLEDLSPAEIAGMLVICRQPGRGKDGGRVKHGHHAPERETNSRACACHAPMHGRLERLRGASVEAEDTSEPIGEARVVQKLTEKHRSRSKNFDPRT
jgi:hypothetical protein